MIPGDKDAVSGDLRQRGSRGLQPQSNSPLLDQKEILEEKDPKSDC